MHTPATASRTAETPITEHSASRVPPVPARTHLHVYVSVRRACGTHRRSRAGGGCGSKPARLEFYKEHVLPLKCTDRYEDTNRTSHIQDDTAHQPHNRVLSLALRSPLLHSTGPAGQPAWCRKCDVGPGPLRGGRRPGSFPGCGTPGSSWSLQPCPPSRCSRLLAGVTTWGRSQPPGGHEDTKKNLFLPATQRATRSTEQTASAALTPTWVCGTGEGLGAWGTHRQPHAHHTQNSFWKEPARKEAQG